MTVEVGIMRGTFALLCLVGAGALGHGCLSLERREWTDAFGCAVVLAVAAIWAGALYTAGWL